jgi:2-polyprenyl-3-methyl-5-hydroxy-6-metoxy-1,4-benzoquinol methylase
MTKLFNQSHDFIIDMPGQVSGAAPQTDYILGHSAREVRRLRLQADILRPVTERLLRGAGVCPGMRVLDVGCGAGDVSMLAADLVGPSGAVVGVDGSREVLAVARERARAAGYRQVRFEESSVESFADPGCFDVVVGRYVLIHQADPAAFLSRVAGLARPGGVVAFHELNIDSAFRSLPAVPLWEQTGEWIRLAFRSMLPHRDAGGRLIEHFSRAGLPQPTLFCECEVGGDDDSPLYAWAAETLASLLPQLFRQEIVTAEAVGIDSLEARLREAVVAARSQVVGPEQFCAWASV